jgi:death-on-curing protein
MFTWINRRALLLLHGESLVIHGGAPGIRDQGLLDSALARPESIAADGQPDVFDCAAAYAFRLAKNHPFIGGNKRAGFLGAGMFLRLNGYRLTATRQDATLTMLALAASEISEADYAARLRKYSISI